MSEERYFPHSKKTGLRPQIPKQTKTEIFPGLNDITDVFEAFPIDIIRYFTLLKEIDAKCVSVVPALNAKIKHFKKLPNLPELKEQRTESIREISKLIKDLLPCLEEKMHVASIAADKAVNCIDRVNDDFELIFKNEIPENVKLGPYHHPAIISDSKIPDTKSAQTQRSESRREALAAKKAANSSAETDIRKEGTPGPDSTATPTGPSAIANANKKRKTTANSTTEGQVTGDSSRPGTPSGTNAPSGTAGAAKRRSTNNKKKPTAATSNSTHTSSNLSSVHTNRNANSTASSNNNNSNNSTNINNNNNNNNTIPNHNHQHPHAGLISNSGISNELNNAEFAEKRDSDEPLYCYCNQVSYGEMVGCDGDDCKREWFHLPCIGLATLPKGKWYCDECNAKLKKARRV